MVELSYEQKLELLRKSLDPDFYTKKYLDLSVARTNEEFVVTGTFLYVLEATAGAEIDIRFNRANNEAITLQHKFKINTPFERVYITNAAQAGKTITIVFAPSSELFDIILPAEISSITSIGSIADPVTIINGALPTGATAVNKSVYNSAAIIHTVTAGKTLYLTGCNMQGAWNADGVTYLEVRNASAVVQYSLMILSLYSDESDGLVQSFSPPLVIPANYDIYFNKFANHFAGASIFGYEV